MPTDSLDAYLRIENVTKKFGDFTALKDISLEVFEGEFVCFLGPSGCGKTTLLRAIAGLDIQTSGQVFQKDRNISALPPAERDFGIVFQSYALFPNLTVKKNVAYGLEQRKFNRTEIESRVSDLLTLVGLPEQGDKYPAQLSGGQQQRVALARALAIEPGLLLLDEPLSALDAKVRAHLRHEIKELQDKLGVTTVMVTHDQEEALTMADRIVVMNQGVIEQVGTPYEIYREPATPFVADFIGTTNFIRAQVTAPGKLGIGSVSVSTDPAHPTPGAGTKVVICIRPEDVLVDKWAASAPGAFDATIDHVEFLGSFHRVHFRPISGIDTAFSVDVSAMGAREVDLSAGIAMKVAFPADHIHIYPAKG